MVGGSLPRRTRFPLLGVDRRLHALDLIACTRERPGDGDFRRTADRLPGGSDAPGGAVGMREHLRYGRWKRDRCTEVASRTTPPGPI